MLVRVESRGCGARLNRSKLGPTILPNKILDERREAVKGIPRCSFARRSVYHKIIVQLLLLKRERLELFVAQGRVGGRWLRQVSRVTLMCRCIFARCRRRGGNIVCAVDHDRKF
jgi:hypothetical protein